MIFFNAIAATNKRKVGKPPLVVTPYTKIVDVGTQLSIGQMMFPTIYKSSEHPQFTTTKPYFTIYSTDHESNANGQIWWGQMDDPNWTNFAEVARIPTAGDGFQPESPYLVTKDGVGHIFYHTSAADSRNGSGQSTHVMVTSGGAAPHLCTYTETINVLGWQTGENHTGYLIPLRLNDGTYIGYHSAYTDADLTLSYSAISSSPDIINWTRVATIEHARILPDGSGRRHDRLNMHPFYYNGVLYNMLTGNQKVYVAKVDSNYLPSEFVIEIYDKQDFTTQNFYSENGIGYVGIRSTEGTYTPVPGAALDGDWYQITFNTSAI